MIRLNSMLELHLDELRQLLARQSDLELVVLIGSQVQGNPDEHSDWDFAIRWLQVIEPIQQLGKTETLRRLLAKQLKLAEAKIDLIDLTRATLAMRAVVAEEGLILKGEESLAWAHFLQRTWRDLESFYWGKIYAA